MMKKVRLLLIISIILLVVSSGCMTSGTSNSTTKATGTQKTTTNATATTATQLYGSIDVTSNPWGASIALDGRAVGTTPKTLVDVPVGRHEILLTMPDYQNINGTIEVKSGQTAKFSKSLSLLKPDVKISVSSSRLQYGSPCKWIIEGSVTNVGAIDAKYLNVTVDMKPAVKDYSTESKTLILGTLQTGSKKEIYIEVPVDCSVDYKGTIKSDYSDKNDKTYTSTANL